MNNKVTLDTLSADINKIIIESESFTEQINSKETKYLQILTQKKQKKEQVSPTTNHNVKDKPTYKISVSEIDEQLNKPNNLLDFQNSISNINKAFIVDDIHINPNNKSVTVVKLNFELFFSYYNFKDTKILNHFTTAKETATREEKIRSLPKYVDFKEFTRFFLKINDSYTQGQFHEYIPIHKLFFKYKDELEKDFDEISFKKNQPNTFLIHSIEFYRYEDRLMKYDSNNLISYTDICGVDSPFVKHFNIRFETQFDYWLINKFKYHPLFGKHLDKIPIVLQYAIENQTKVNDGCIMNEILFEVQESGVEHCDNSNDDYKKNCAIKDNKIMVYYHQKTNTQSDRTKFWDIIEKLVYAILFKKYPEIQIEFKRIDYYDTVYKEIIRFTEEYDITNEKLERLELKEKIDELNDIFKTTETTKLDKFFVWNELWFRQIIDGKDPRIIDLYELLEITSIDEDDFHKIIKNYAKDMSKDSSNLNKIKYKMNWETMINIVGDPLNEKQRTRRNLNKYLSYADLSYRKIINMILYKSDLFEKLTIEANLLNMNDAKTKSDNMIAGLRIKNKSKDDFIILQDKKIKIDNEIQRELYIDVIQKNNLFSNLNANQLEITKKWIKNYELIKNQIMIGSKSNINTPIEICIKVKYGPLLKISGSKKEFSIIYTFNPKDKVLKEELLGILKDFNIPPRIRDKLILHLTGREYDIADIPAFFTGLKINNLYIDKKCDLVAVNENTFNVPIIPITHQSLSENSKGVQTTSLQNNILNENKNKNETDSDVEDMKNEFC